MGSRSFGYPDVYLENDAVTVVARLAMPMSMEVRKPYAFEFKSEVDTWDCMPELCGGGTALIRPTESGTDGELVPSCNALSGEELLILFLLLLLVIGVLGGLSTDCFRRAATTIGLDGLPLSRLLSGGK